MLRKKKRLSTALFDHVFNKGRFITSRSFSIKYVFVPTPDSRISVVATKKTSPRAVTRNAIRRRLYRIINQEDTPKYTHIVFIASPSVISKSISELKNEVVELFKKVERTRPLG